MRPVTVAQRASFQEYWLGRHSVGCQARALRSDRLLLLNISRAPHCVGKQDPRSRALRFGFDHVRGNRDGHVPILCRQMDTQRRV